ncbi:MAG TPA: TIR domain-containing protein [Puia sp.]|nr:TIR domain-containing protein [Puia sp.]
MLEFLNIIPNEKVISAIYYAVRTLRHLRGKQVESLETEKDFEEKDLGLQIVSEITDKEKKFLSDFDQKTIDKYVTELYNYITSRNIEDSKKYKSLKLDNLEIWRNESVHNYEQRNYERNYKPKIFISSSLKDHIRLDIEQLLSTTKVDIYKWEENQNIGKSQIESFIENSALVVLGIFIISKTSNNNITNLQLFELGYLIGRLGRNKILVLTDKESKLPSTLQGMYHIDTTSKDWKNSLIQQLDLSGISFHKAI